MIVDQIENISRYRGWNKALDVLIEWLSENDWRALPLGRTDIDGDRVFANVQEVTTRQEAAAHYEWHRRYLDVQVDVTGREAFKVTSGRTTAAEPYDAEHDIAFCDADPADGGAPVAGDLDHDRFVIYLAGEPHMPNLVFPADGPQAIKKICFKVAAD